MCLRLESEKTRVQIAKEDIVCYKELKEVEYLDLSSLEDGQKFTGVIKNIPCQGAISIENDRIFFCTDDERLEGLSCRDKKGYRFSWVEDERVTEINGIPRIPRLETPYRGFPVEIDNTYTSILNKISNVVEEGLHSYCNLESIEGEIVARCIIPKGSKYYKGIFEGYQSYASDTLKYVELIKD